MICIWCLETNADKRVEHIIPEPLGCPPELEWKEGAVCGRCNNGLGHLDQAVIHDLDFQAFMAGIPRKRGRPPAIDSRGNVRGTLEPSGPTLTINMDRGDIKAHDGSRLAGYRGGNRDIKGEFERSGALAEISFKVPLGKNLKFVRGITKIAFTLLAHRIGADQVLESHFDAVRRYVLGGEGVRHIVVSADGDTQYRHEVTSFTFKKSGEHAIAVRLGVPEFLVEFSSEDRFQDLVMLAQEFRPGQWTVLPVEE